MFFEKISRSLSEGHLMLDERQLIFITAWVGAILDKAEFVCIVLLPCIHLLHQGIELANFSKSSERGTTR
jgi:hypothetical protein